MPAINKSFLELLQDDFTKYKCFIETGTYLGETIFSVEPLFNRITRKLLSHTILSIIFSIFFEPIRLGNGNS